MHDWLDKNGFIVVYLEDFCVEEQISLFNEAEVIVAVHGAALTNILFTKKNTKVVEIGHERGSPTCFEDLAKELGLVNYMKVKAKGWFTLEEEEKLSEKTGMLSTNLLPLLFSDEIKAKLLML